MSQGQRPLSATDKLILKGYTSSPWRHVLPFAWGFVFLWGIATAVLFTLWRWLAPYAGVADPLAYNLHVIGAIGIAVAAYVGHGFASFMRQALASRRDPTSMHALAVQDLKANAAHVDILDVAAAVEIKEFEDEGAGFFLALDDGRVLCVIGQDLYDFAHDATGDAADGIEDERHKFPHTRIEYTYAPQSKVRLDIKGVGEPLRPRALVETSRKQFKRGGTALPEDGAFYDGPLEAVLKRFGYVEKPVPADPLS